MNRRAGCLPRAGFAEVDCGSNVDGKPQKVQQSIAGDSASCDTVTLAAVDVSGDRQVTSLDALMILQAVGGR